MSKLVKTKERVSQHGEVFTPEHIVKDMIALFPNSDWSSLSCVVLEPTCGLIDYTPTESKEDYGVDAIAKNIRNIDVVVQVKYRSNESSTDSLITYEDLAKTVCNGLISYDINTRVDDSLVLFTNSDVNYIAKDYLKKSLRVINGKYIRKLVDGNFTFWVECYSMLEKTFEKERPERKIC